MRAGGRVRDAPQMNEEDPQPSADAALETAAGDAADGGAAGGLTPEEQLAEAERRAEEFRDQALRAHAELENTRKRTEKEIQRVHKYALESFALELLDIKDNLERSLSGDVSAGTAESVREGIRLTLKSLERVFGRFGIKEVSPAGQAFDPALHQAMSVLATEEHAPKTVIEVAQKGYLLHDRLLRPAMVVVAAKPAGDGPAAAAGSEETGRDGETP